MKHHIPTRARNKPPADCKARVAAFVALFDPAYEPNPYDPFEDDVTTTEPPKPRRTSLARAVKTAREAGVDVVVNRDGAITLCCSRLQSTSENSEIEKGGNGLDPSTAENSAVENEWDEVLRR